MTEATHALFATSGHDPATSRNLAEGIMYGIVRQQAGAMAYVDVFFMLTLAFIAFLPFILLLAGKKGRSTPDELQREE